MHFPWDTLRKKAADQALAKPSVDAMKAGPVLSKVLGPQILAALGLPHQRVRSFSLHFRAGHPVTVEVEYLAFADAPLEPVLRQFVLVDRTTMEPAQAVG